MVCNHCVKPFVFSPFSNRLHKNWTSEPFAVHLRHVCYFSFFFANLTRIDWYVCVLDTPWNLAEKTVCISKQAGQLSWSLSREKKTKSKWINGYSFSYCFWISDAMQNSFTYRIRVEFDGARKKKHSPLRKPMGYLVRTCYSW